VFPVTDDARDVVAALERYMATGGVHIRTNARVTALSVHPTLLSGVQVALGGETIPADAVVLATGGASWPRTGSTGDGYDLAAALGHSLVPLRPALVPLMVEEVELARSMQGVSLRNVRLTAYRGRAEEIDPALTPTADFGRGCGPRRPPKGVIESRMGELMLTHFGLGGR